jgi:glycosyltransferase involved in cell wall biosynthesis
MTMIHSRGLEQEDDRAGSTMPPSGQSPARSGAVEAVESPRHLRRPLRICLVSGEFLGPYRTGGIGTAYTKLGEVLNEAGHDVTFLYTNGRFTVTEPIEHWIDFYRRLGIRLVPLPEISVNISSLSSNLATGYRVYQWLREHDGFDVVHFPDYQGLGIHAGLARHQGLAFRGTTTVVGLHGCSRWARRANQQYSLSDSDLENDSIERHSAELADVVWSPSQYMMDWVAQQGWDLPRRRHVQPLVVPLPQGRSPRHRVTRPIRELVFFGRQEVRKGLFIFLDAIDRLAEVSATDQLDGLVVTILGKSLTIDGQESEQIIRARSQRWPFPTRILADRDHEQALAYLQAGGRLAVIPSLDENYPNTVLECLSLQVPFLASRVGGIPEQIHPVDLERVCFDPNPRCLSARLRHALREGHSPARLSFDPERNNCDWVRWHERLADERHDAGTSQDPGGGAGAATTTVSVCVAHYNRPQLLRQALDSILAQDEPPLEVIVVDDGSPDAVVQDELDALARDYDFPGRGWRLIRQENRFLGAARNRAAREARGDYLLFMDDDNAAKPHEISTFLRVARHTGADVLTCIMDMFEGNHAPGMHTVPTCRWLCHGANIPMSLLYNPYGDANAMIRRTAFQEVGGYTEEFGVGHEDWELYSRLILKGYNLQLVPEPLFWHRTTPGSLTHSTPVRRNFLRSLRPHLEYIPDLYQPFFEMCIGQSLVDRGLLWNGEPTPSPATGLSPVPTWPLRYRLVDGLNARLKRLSFLHRAGKASIQAFLRLRRRIRDRRSVRSGTVSPVDSALGRATEDRPATEPRRAETGSIADPRAAFRRPASYWPCLEEEVGEYKRYFKGNVLNAGAGCRDLSTIVEGELTNQDIPHGNHNANIHIFSPIHEIPVDDDHFDSVFCNAVLEHVANPTEVVEEIYRVLKPGGYLYLCIPFLQPEHLDPTDFQRYTKDGLRKLVTDQGFEVVKVEGVHTVYHTLGWIVEEWLESNHSISYRILRRILYPILRYKTRTSKAYVDSLASAYRILARKPASQALARSA